MEQLQALGGPTDPPSLALVFFEFLEALAGVALHRANAGWAETADGGAAVSGGGDGGAAVPGAGTAGRPAPESQLQKDRPEPARRTNG